MPCDVIFKIIGYTCRYPSTRAIAAGAAVGAAVGSSRRAPGHDWDPVAVVCGKATDSEWARFEPNRLPCTH